MYRLRIFHNEHYISKSYLDTRDNAMFAAQSYCKQGGESLRVNVTCDEVDVHGQKIRNDGEHIFVLLNGFLLDHESSEQELAALRALVHDVAETADRLDISDDEFEEAAGEIAYKF